MKLQQYYRAIEEIDQVVSIMTFIQQSQALEAQLFYIPNFNETQLMIRSFYNADKDFEVYLNHQPEALLDDTMNILQSSLLVEQMKFQNDPNRYAEQYLKALLTTIVRLTKVLLSKLVFSN